jgi:large conductance mechanosensitive channel
MDEMKKLTESEPAKKAISDQLKQLTESKPAKKAISLLDEFKKFAFKGNMIDLAVGVIIGTAFGNIIQSLVKNIFMPLISLVIPGEEGYRNWKITVDQKEVPYGLFLGELVNFLVVAFVLYLFIVKFLGWITRAREKEPPPLTKDQELLSEIRDLLKKEPAAPEPAPAPLPAPA